MNLQAQLTKRQEQVAGRIVVFGEAKKQVADKLDISTKTVENTVDSIYKRLQVNSIGQLCTWWYATKLNIPLDKIYSTALSLFFICLVCVNEINTDDTAVRVRSRTCRVKTGKRKQS